MLAPREPYLVQARYLTIHETIQGLIPPLRPDELAQLEASLLAEGCREPLCVWWEQADTYDCKYCYAAVTVHYDDGHWVCDQCGYGLIPDNYILLDGHNRHRLCEKHDIPYTFREIDLPSWDAAEIWVLQNQLGRRNLTDLDRVALALKLKPMLEEQARQSQGTRTDLPHNCAESFHGSEVREDLAKTAGVASGSRSRKMLNA